MTDDKHREAFDWRDLETCDAVEIAGYFAQQKGKWSMDIDCNDFVYAFVNLASRVHELEDAIRHLTEQNEQRDSHE